MPTITSIMQQSKKERFNVFLDGEFAFSVSIDAVIKYKLKEGLLLSNTLINQISTEEEQNYAFSLALKYINILVPRKAFWWQNSITDLKFLQSQSQQYSMKVTAKWG